MSELMETIASLDLRDQWWLFKRQGELDWEMRQLRGVERRLVERAWQTVDDSIPMMMKIAKV